MTASPRRYLILALIAIGLFAILATLVEADTFLVRGDARLVQRFRDFTIKRPAVLDTVVFVTDLGTGRALWVVGGLAVLILLLRGECLRAMVWTAGLLASRPVSPWLKGQFERVRPPYIDWPDFSFPSGHAWGSSVVYGMLALAVLHVLKGRRWRWLIASALWIWIGLIALSRPMLGVHYPSDVLAGTSLGLGWGFLWAALAEWLGRRKQLRTSR